MTSIIMKKLIIGVVVLLAAALIGLKYFDSGKQPGAIQAPLSGQVEQQGVALPPGSTAYIAPENMTSYTPAQATGSYEQLVLPPAALTLKGACEGGSPKEIMESHGKTWGYYTGTRIAFKPEKTQEMYVYIWDYYACTAVSRGDPAVCNDLPGEAPKDLVRFNIPIDRVGGTPITPVVHCRNKNVEFFFKAYVAGKAKDERNCRDYLNEWDPRNLERISPADFCSAAGQGPEKALAYVKEKMPDMYTMAEKMLAFSRKACGSSSDCLADNALWEGISTGNPDKCPTAYRTACAALAQKSPAPCSGILAEMSRKYCSYHKDLVKLGGGYAGFTPDEVKDSLAAAAKKKAEEDLLRKEQEATTKQINEKVRKLMGKKGDE